MKLISALKASKVFYVYSAVALFFPLRGLKSPINFCSQSCTNILTKCSAPHGWIRSLKLSDSLKLSSKQTELQMGMYFFKFLLVWKFVGVWKPHKPPGNVDMRNVKLKDNGMDQNALQFCYDHNVTMNQQT